MVTPEEIANAWGGKSSPMMRMLGMVYALPHVDLIETRAYRMIFEQSPDLDAEALIRKGARELLEASEEYLLTASLMDQVDSFRQLMQLLEMCRANELQRGDSQEPPTLTQETAKNYPLSFEAFKDIIVNGEPFSVYFYHSKTRRWRVLLNTNADPSRQYIESRDPSRLHERREQERQYANAVSANRQMVQKMGFPYSDTFNEYLRFLNTNFREMKFDGKVLTFQNIKEFFFPIISNRPNFKRGHTYIVGRSGSGKSELLKSIYHLSKSSRIVIDPHGDLSRDIGSFSRESDFLIAPHKSPFTINPFVIDDITSSHRELVAQEITALIAELVEDSGLSRLMETIMFPIVYTLLACEYADFKMLSECINPNTGKEKLKALRPFVEPHHLTIWNELEGDTYDSSKQSVFNRLQSLLNYRLILNATSGEDDFGRAMKAVEGGGSIIISLPIPEIGEAVAVTLGRFFMTRLQIWAKARQSIPEEKRIPVLLLIDEFHNFLSHGTAETLDQFGRKFRLFMVLAHQHIQQLTDREVRGSILANTVNKIAGVSNTETRNALAREMLIEPDALEDLKVGTFVGRFGNSPPLTFRARMVPNGKTRVNYFPSINENQSIDGWRKLATSPPVRDFETSPNHQKQPNQEPPRTGAFKPKFDI